MEEVEHKYNLLKTKRKEALQIIGFLVGYHSIKENEIDFSD